MARKGRPRNTPESVWLNIKKKWVGCWLWTGAVDKDGYGKITINYQDHRVHRVVFKLTKGDPGDLPVLHTCDNPPCCRPSHLYLGTHADNARDRDERKRGFFISGERHPHAQLTDADIALIRQLANEGKSRRELMDRFGISRTHVIGIINRTRR